MSESWTGPAEAPNIRQRRWLALIALAYLLLGLIYALATPPLEASDEYKHYPVVQHIQTTGSLPVLEPEAPGRWLQEAAQPPLYYLAMAALTWPIDTSDLPALHQLNKYAFVGDPNQSGNKNLIIHQPELERFPWSGSVLAIQVIRLASLLLGLGTVLVTAWLGRLLAGGMAGLLAAALTAFNPMFLFVHAAVNNDSLAIFLGSLGVYWLVRLWRDAPDPRRQWGRYLWLGVILGLGLLTKLSLGGLLGLALLAMVWLARRQRSWSTLRWATLWIALPALLLPAAWFWRNLQLYGDPTALNVFVAVQDQREGLPGLADWVGEFGTLYRSFWALFGGVNIAAPGWIYYLLNCFALLALLGLALWLVRQRTEWRRLLIESGLWLLPAWALLVFLLLVRWNLYAASFQGRLLFPAIAAINVLLAMGSLLALPAGWQRRVAPALAGGLLIIALFLPWSVIRPAYAQPAPQAAVPTEAEFGPFTFSLDGEEYLRLVGVEIAPDQRVAPGGVEPVKVSLYWQAAQPMPGDYLTAVSLLGRELAPVAHVNRHPAGGMLPTSEWQPGQIWRDDYTLFPGAEAAAPALLRVRAGVYDPDSNRDLAAAGPDGAPVSLLIVGEAVLKATENFAPVSNVEVGLEEGIVLQGYSLTPMEPVPGQSLQLTLYWQSEQTPGQDYTVFVQLLDSAGQQIAGADSPPVDGDYPTSLWRAGEIIDDPHTMLLPADLPPGDYQLAVGLYDPASGQRLSRQDGSGDTIFIPLRIAPDD